MISFSTFPSITTTDGQQQFHDWPEYAKTYLNQFLITNNKKDVPLYSPAVYLDSYVHRGDANVIGMNAVCIDFDNAIGRGNDSRCSDDPSWPEDHETNLDGLTYAWHSTHSNTKDWPRWRLVIPTSRVVTPNEFKQIFAYVVELLAHDTNIDQTCGDLSRAYWLPSCPLDNEQYAFSGFTEGEPLDVDTIIETPVKTNVYELPTAQPQTIPSYSGRNDALKAQVAACLSQGKSIDQTVAEILEYDSTRHTPPLFTDIKEGMRGDAYTNALKFVTNIIGSINQRRIAQGQEPQTSLVKEEPPFKFNRAKNLLSQLKGANYLIKPYFERDSVTLLFGDSDTYKSFLMVDVGMHVAYGDHYCGMPTHQGAVAFIVGEGQSGIARRIAAWQMAHNKNWSDDIDLIVSEIPTELINPDKVEQVAESIGQEFEGVTPALIVIDTLSTNAGEAEESSNSDMAQVMKNIAVILRHRFGACVVVVHHVGHGEKGRERGAYAIRGNTDNRIQVESQGEDSMAVNLTCMKTKDAPKWDPIAFMMDSWLLPGIQDSEGEETYSLVPRATDYVAPKKREKKSAIDEYKEIIFKLAREQKSLLESQNMKVPDFIQVSVEQVRDRRKQNENAESSRDLARLRNEWSRVSKSLYLEFPEANYPDFGVHKSEI